MSTCKRAKVKESKEDVVSMSTDEEEEVDMEINGTKHRKLTRAEKSKLAAKCRRDKEAVEFNNIIGLLPFPNEELEKMDKSSVVKLTSSYLKMVDFIDKEMKSLSIEDTDDKQIVSTPPTNGKVSLPSNGSPLISESQMMLEALNGFLILLDRKRRILFVSKNVEDHLGLPQVQLIGKSIEEFLEEKDIPELRKQFNLKFLSNGKQCDVMETNEAEPSTQIKDLYHQLDEHRMFYLRMQCQFKHNKAKYKGHTLVQWSGRLKMRKTNKANNFATQGLICTCKVMQTNSILEIKMDGNMFMSRHDLGMTFTFCDPRIITLIGYEPSEVIGRTAYQFHNPLDAERVRICHTNLIVKGSSVSKYYRFVGKNCDWVWMQTRATIIYNTNNIPQYIVCMNYIISEEEGIRVSMEEDKESLNCTGVMDISCRPYKPREPSKGDNHDHHSDNGYHSSYSPYSSINPSPLSESSFSHRQCESDDCGASVDDTNDDFPMSVVQECASSLDPDAAHDEEMIKFIESLDGNDENVSQNNQLVNENGQWNAMNMVQMASNYPRRPSLQRIKSCPIVSSLQPCDTDFDDQPIEFMCKSSNNNSTPFITNQFDSSNGMNNNFNIPKQGLVNIQIGSLNNGNLLESSTLSESLPKEISDFCMQYAESMADMQAQDIISQFAQENSLFDFSMVGGQSQNVQTNSPLIFREMTSQESQPSFVNQSSFTNMQSALPITQQTTYTTSPQVFYARNTDTPNSFISGSSVSSPQTCYSNLNSPLSLDTNIASPNGDFSNVMSPTNPQTPCSIGMNNLTLNPASSPVRQNPVNQACSSPLRNQFPNQVINGHLVTDRNVLKKLSNSGNLSQSGLGSRSINGKARTNGHSVCNRNNQVLGRMAPPSNHQMCTQSRPAQNKHNTNNGIKSPVAQNTSKGLRNVKSMSELEKMLRGYSPPFLQEKNSKSDSESLDSSCTLLQQMLTGKLSGEKYIAMEKQRQLNSAIRTSHSSC